VSTRRFRTRSRWSTCRSRIGFCRRSWIRRTFRGRRHVRACGAAWSNAKDRQMARWEFKLPDIGEGVTEGEVVTWLVQPGDVVQEDQPMVEVMTDKATVTITAPKAGKILETRGKVGEIVQVHGVLVVFDVGAGGDAAAESTNGHGTNGTKKQDGKDD